MRRHRNGQHPRGAVTAMAAGIILLALACSSCSQDPTEANAPTGSNALANGLIPVAFRDTTITAIGDSTFKQFVPMDGRVNLVGRFNNRYTALSALEFFGSTFPLRDTVTVLSAKLTLRAASWFGDSTAHFGFTVYKINQGWNAITVQWDTVSASFYDGSVARGTYSGAVGPDTQQVTVDLDTAMVRTWFQNATTTTPNYGIVLIPDLSTNVVRGFHSFFADSASKFPFLTVVATSPAGVGAVDTTTYASGQATFVGNIDNLNTNPALLYLQAGVVYRSTLQFDVSFIPRGAIINEASLRLRLDPGTSHLTRFSDSAAYARMLFSSTDFSQYDAIAPSEGKRLPGTPTTFAFDLRHEVQTWSRGPGTNFGLLLSATSSGLVGGTPDGEHTSFDLYAFSNTHAAADTLKPRLKIIYSVEKK